MTNSVHVRGLPLLFFCAITLLFAGCMTTPRVDDRPPELDTFIDLMIENNIEEAESLLGQLERDYSGNMHVRKERAKFVFYTEGAEAAMPLFETLITEYPEWPIPYYWRAMCKAALGEYDAALKDADTLIALEKKQGEEQGDSHELRAQILLDMENGEAAKSDFLTALSLNEALPDSYFGLGVIAIVQTGDFDEGISWFTKGLSYEPSHFLMNRGLAMAYQEKRDWAKSIEYWTKVIELYPNDPQLYFDRSMVYANVNPVLAVADLDKVIELAPDYAQAYWSRGMLKKLYLRDPAGAKADYDKAVQLEPQLIHDPYPEF